MARHLVVDGYNLARSGELFLQHDPASPAGRGDLCVLLSSYARAKGFCLTVVFDGRGSGRRERSREAFKGGTAVYSSRSETADDVIREIARSAPAGTIVVTSDRGLAGTLPGRSAAVVSCSAFAARLFDFRMEEVKGAADFDAERRPVKKGEGRREKKTDRRRNRILRNL
jgi:predicted RNA-binding protein with PIN domain